MLYIIDLRAHDFDSRATFVGSRHQKPRAGTTFIEQTTSHSDISNIAFAHRRWNYASAECLKQGCGNRGFDANVRICFIWPPEAHVSRHTNSHNSYFIAW